MHQVTVPCHPFAAGATRLGVIAHSLYAWVKRHSKAHDVDVNAAHAIENGRLNRELAHVTEERDIFKKATVR